MEITRTIQIQITGVIDNKDIREDTPEFIPTEYVEQEVREIFKDADQVLVEVKDFIRD